MYYVIKIKKTMGLYDGRTTLLCMQYTNNETTREFLQPGNCFPFYYHLAKQ